MYRLKDWEFPGRQKGPGTSGALLFSLPRVFRAVEPIRPSSVARSRKPGWAGSDAGATARGVAARAATRPYHPPDRGPRPRRRGGMRDRDYCYPPGYTVLRNRLNIRNASALEAAERELAAHRLLEPVPAGDFDLDHPEAIHRHLFQDAYAVPLPPTRLWLPGEEC